MQLVLFFYKRLVISDCFELWTVLFRLEVTEISGLDSSVHLISSRIKTSLPPHKIVTRAAIQIVYNAIIQYGCRFTVQKKKAYRTVCI